jgi:hypothetical protein
LPEVGRSVSLLCAYSPRRERRKAPILLTASSDSGTRPAPIWKRPSRHPSSWEIATLLEGVLQPLERVREPGARRHSASRRPGRRARNRLRERSMPNRRRADGPPE